MGRKLKPASLPYGVALCHSILVKGLAPSNMPKDPLLRAKIIKALMERIQKFYPQEYNHCFGRISSIAKFEAAPDHLLLPGDRDVGISEGLNELATYPALRLRHNKIAIEIHREGLQDLFAQGGYTTAHKKMHWIHEQWDSIVFITKETPCFCQHQSTYNTFRLHANDRMKELESIRDSTDLLLAYIHNLKTVSADNLRKVLKNKF